jgi:hypothetical protein
MISYPISLPTTPTTKRVNFIQQTRASASQSPFTGNQQKQVQPAQWWEAQLSLPAMKRTTGGADWRAAIRSLKGKQGCFYLGDPSAKTPRGLASRIGVNLFNWSEAFDNAAWTRTGLSAVTANTTTAPDGNATAEKLVENSATNVHTVSQDESTTTVQRCLSVYAKPAGRDWIYIAVGSAIVYFNVNTGTIGSGVSGAIVATITAAANGFYRCSVYNPVPSGTSRWVGVASGNGSSSYLGDGTSGVYVWGAQLEAGTLSSYIGTTSGAPVVSGANQSGSILYTRGWAPNTTVLKADDYLQIGYGLNATRLQSSGGSTTLKLYNNAVAVPTNGVKYLVSLRVKNMSATKAVTVYDGFSLSQTVAAGAEATITLKPTGNGVDAIGIQFVTPASGDSIDVIVWDPYVGILSAAANAIAVTERNFTGTGWVANSGATITKTQLYNQRLYQTLTDVVTDADGYAAIDILPTLRPDGMLDGDPITLTNPRGIFQLADNKFDTDFDTNGIFGMSFNALEVL